MIQGLKVAPVLLNAPSLAGTGKIGQAVTVDPGLWGGSPAPTLAVRWLRNGTEIAGATGLSYQPVAADDGTDLRARVLATSSAGSLTAETTALRITYPAPVAVGGLADQALVQGDSPAQVEAAAAFTGEALSYSVTGAG